MKRDMDLVRELLLAIEEDKELLPNDTCSCEAMEHHRWLIHEAGFATSGFHTIKSSTGLEDFPPGQTMRIPQELTWAGHDFLDAMRDETIWKKCQENVLKPGVSFTFSILLEWLKQEAKEKLGIRSE